MNLDKIGKYIASKRKLKNLTQEQLAEKLNITDRAVSKWERAICLPDASIMMDLCEILSINVNELLSGEDLKMESYENHAEENLIKLKSKEEIANKKLLNYEWVIVTSGTISFITLIIIAGTIEMPFIYKVVIIGIAITLFAVAIISAMNIEKNVGYYECQKCHNKYIPSNKQMWFSMHIIRDRYIKCPKCHQKSWHKKVLTKE